MTFVLIVIFSINLALSLVNDSPPSKISVVCGWLCALVCAISLAL